MFLRVDFTQTRRKGQSDDQRGEDGAANRVAMDHDYTWLKCCLRSNSQNHYFGGFDQSGGAFSWLEAHLLRGVGGADSGDGLLPEGHRPFAPPAPVRERTEAAGG